VDRLLMWIARQPFRLKPEATNGLKPEATNRLKSEATNGLKPEATNHEQTSRGFCLQAEVVKPARQSRFSRYSPAALSRLRHSRHDSRAEETVAAVISAIAMVAMLLATAAPARAQDTPSTPASPPHHAAESGHAALFPARDASGTSWLPDETPMYGVRHTLGTWDVMLHGRAFVQFLYEPGEIHRTGGFSSHQASSANWIMAMGRRPAGAGRLGFRAMASVEPWTVRDCGFINLLASGEMCEGDTIHDRQHPHDLFMEVAADYDRPLGRSLRWQLYAGLSGEPALGPPPFPHRVSAMPNPTGPISHHWLDSSHITFGLVTTGLYDRRWKAEMSVFNGREPDEDRADFDFGALDSVSGRLTFLPTRRLALQVSAGHLNDAEAEFPPQPRSDLDRATASMIYHRATRQPGFLAVTLAYGVNAGREAIPEGTFDLVTHAVLLESSFTIRERHTWFGRIEAVGKPGHDLHVHEAPADVFVVGRLQAGYVRYFNAWKGIVSGLGGTASLNIVPSALAPRYSGRVAPGFGVFFTVRPSRHTM
jgi:hypothetical protein